MGTIGLFIEGRFGLQAFLSWKTRLSTHFRPPSRLICPNWCGNFVAKLLELRQEVADLRRENSELRQQVGYWKAQHARAVHRAEHLEAEVENLRGENRKLQDQLFGRKSEKSSTRDRSNHLEGESEDQDSSTPRKRGQRKDRPGPKRRDYSHLPVVDDLRELPEDQRVCPQCGAALSPSDTEDSEQIEIEVRAYRRRIRRRRYQRTCTCSNCPRTVTAPPAPKLIPKGVLGVSVWVEILLDKFASHRPTERLLGQWQLLGLDVARAPWPAAWNASNRSFSRSTTRC